MDLFEYRDGQLFCEDVNVDNLASKISTPFYLYSEGTILNHFEKFKKAFIDLKPQICYSIKNCNNINIIKVLIDKGAGIDVVSGGEIYKAIEAGADSSKIVYAGVGKSEKEIEYAISQNIGWLNIESEQEFEIIGSIAVKLNKTIKVALRVNPNVYDSKTHHKLATGKGDSKFGVDISKAFTFFQRYGAHPYVKLIGLHIHLGSPIYTTKPFETALIKIMDLKEKIKSLGINIQMIDIGGGYIAHYDGQEVVFSWDDYASTIVPILKPFVDSGGEVILEPGRSITANAGVLITKVEYTKIGIAKKFVILDTGMNHLVRPTMYEAYHFIWPTLVKKKFQPLNRLKEQIIDSLESYDVVGPICESSDYLGRDRKLPPVERGDLMCIFTTGAYGIVMSSNYNATLKPMEVLVSGKSAKIIRKREEYSDLIRLEKNVKLIEMV